MIIVIKELETAMKKRLRTSLSILTLTALGVLTNLSLDAESRPQRQHSSLAQNAQVSQ
jgi:hypothetical protein